MVLIPAYTGKGKEFFYTSDIIKASKIIPFLVKFLWFDKFID